MPAEYVSPSHAVILTLDDKTRLSRQIGRDDNSKKDTFESKSLDFQHKVDNAYLKIAKDFNIKTIDASPSPAEIQKTLLKNFGL